MNDKDASPLQNPDGRGRQPIFNLPGILTASICLLVAIYLFETNLLSDTARETLFFYGGFVPARYVHPISGQGLEWFSTPVTYSLLHGGIEHLAFNCLWLAAFGAPVVRRIGALRYGLYWIVSAVASALFFMALHWGEASLLIGASGVISALMGSACRFAFPPEGLRFGGPVHLLPRLGVIEALRSGTVRVFVIMWFVGNMIFALGIPLLGDVGAIAWEAHIGGFLFGFFLFALFDPQPRQPA